MFEVIVHFFVRDTQRFVTDNPAHVLADMVMSSVSRIECNSLAD